MRKPAAVTGIAYIQFLTIWNMIKTFDTPLVGRTPLYLGSWLSPHGQWAYYRIEVIVTVIATVGLMLGRNGSRWLLLIGALAGWIVAVPVRNMQGIPLYLASLLFGSILLSLLFLAPSARLYFSLPRREKAPISLRGLFAGVFYATGALIIYSLTLFCFLNRSPLWLTLIVLLGLPVPFLSLGMVVRKNLSVAYREGAIVLVATALFLLFQFLAKGFLLRIASPESLALVDLEQALGVAVIVAALGLGLARASMHLGRRDRIRTDEIAAR